MSSQTTPFIPPVPEDPSTIVFSTPKIYARHYKPSDIEPSAAQANEPEIAGMMRNRFPSPYTLDSARWWVDHCISQDTKTDFALCDSVTGAFVGSCGLIPGQDVEERKYEMGYWLGKEHWGKGLGTDAAKGLAGYIFQRYPMVVRIEATVFQGNLASEKVLLRCGFTKEGVRRKVVFKNGKVLDQGVFGLLREEWEEEQQQQQQKLKGN